MSELETIKYDIWRKELPRDIEKVNKCWLCFHPRDGTKDNVTFAVVSPESLQGKTLTSTRNQFFEFYSRNQTSYQKIWFLDSENDRAKQVQDKLRAIPGLEAVDYKISSMRFVVYYKEGTSSKIDLNIEG